MLSNYSNWDELAEYARERAIRSAARNGHQEFAYWVRVMEWAREGARMAWPVAELFQEFALIIDERGYGPGFVEDAADIYMRLVHLRRMLINRGEAVQRLSLAWLREEAARL